MKTEEKTKKKQNKDEKTEQQKERLLVLHNDDDHSFDYVIDALINICEHDMEQATQCTFITHYKGKCDVKKGSFTYLSPMKKALIARKLIATID